MKARQITPNSGFKPVEVQFTLESLEDIMVLWMCLNRTNEHIKKGIDKYFGDIPNDKALLVSLNNLSAWELLEEIAVNHNLREREYL